MTMLIKRVVNYGKTHINKTAKELMVLLFVVFFGVIPTLVQAEPIKKTDDNISTLGYQPAVIDYVYSGRVEQFVAPYDAEYQLETWGAQGGSETRNYALGGKGGYSKGTVRLKQGDVLYIHVGGYGYTPQSGYNGGGCNPGHTNGWVCGGGATDMRINANSLNNRIIVAGGGGSVGARLEHGANAGGLVGSNSPGASSSGEGGTQSAAGYNGSFGIGGTGVGSFAGGGGGGWYGGGGAANSSRGGGGGSGYIFGPDSYKPASYQVDSSYYLEDTEIKGGGDTFKLPSGLSTIGNSWSGFARITVLREPTSSYLEKIDIDADGKALSLTPVFDKETNTYNVTLDPDDAKINIRGFAEDKEYAYVTGNGTYEVPSTGLSVSLTVTPEVGDLRIYTVNFTRTLSSYFLPADIRINGLIPSLCDIGEDFCTLTPEFDVNNYDDGFGYIDGYYKLKIPARIRDLDFVVIKGHPFQEVFGEGNNKFLPGKTDLTIEVMSEDEFEYSMYHFEVERVMTDNADFEKFGLAKPKRDFDYSYDVTEYYTFVPFDYDHTDKLVWDIETLDPNSNYTIEGEGPLQLGLNRMIFTVTSANGNVEKEYTVYVYRENDSNGLLKSLSITHKDEELIPTPHFNKIINTYNLTVDYDVTFVDLLAETEVDTSGITYSHGQRVELPLGKTDTTIAVTAQDGHVNTYSLSIYRKMSDENRLKEVIISGEPVQGFDPDVLVQSFDVDSQSVFPGVDGITMHEGASIRISGNYKKFNPGPNTVFIRVTAQDGTDRSYTFTFHKGLSSDSKLENVEANLFDPKPSFDPDVYDYYFNIPFTQEPLEITAHAAMITSKVSGSGTYTLKSGLNVFKFEVTAEDYTTSTYTYNITMDQNSNAKLLELNIDDATFDPDYSPEHTTYDVNVPYSSDKIDIEAIPEYILTQVTGDGEHSLNVGENFISIGTTAEDGTTLVYELKITRDASDNADLKHLIVHEGALSRPFNGGVLAYSVKVPHGTTEVTVEGITDHPEATYEVIGNTNLSKDTPNTVIVRVTPQNQGEVKDYTLTVIVQEEANQDIDLLSLETTPGEFKPNFHGSQQFYRMIVENEVESINVQAIAKDFVDVSGLGNVDLRVGVNVIVVTTTANNGVTKDYQIEVTRKLSSNARLRHLSVGGLDTVFIFNPNRYNYSGGSYRSSLNITPYVEHPGATYEILGNRNFESNSNSLVTIRVTAEDGVTTLEYTINVRVYPSEENDLRVLSLSDVTFTPRFNRHENVYEADVGEDVNMTVITALPWHPKARVETEYAKKLEFGMNFVHIDVFAENGARQRYTVRINKAGNSNNKLSSLLVDDVEIPGFDKDIERYSLEYEYETESIFIDYLKDNELSTVTGDGKIDLEVGFNRIPVSVTSQGGDLRVYYIDVTRKEQNSAYLENLRVKNYPIDNGFNPEIEEYDFLVDNEVTSLDMVIDPRDPGATYTVTGNEQFTVGKNVVRINVTSSKGDRHKEYILNITRQLFGDNKLSHLSVDKGDMIPEDGNNPEFNEDILVYHVELDEFDTEITINAVAKNPTAIVTSPVTYQLEFGVNHLKVPVRSNSGVVRTYHIFVNRNKSNDNYLRSLEVYVGNQKYEFTEAFDAQIMDYTLQENLAPGTPNVNIVVTHTAETVVGDGIRILHKGPNKLDIVVTSASGLERVYTISLNRSPSSNNDVADTVGIVPSAGIMTPNFNPHELNYKLKIQTTDTTLAFRVNTIDKNAIVRGHEEEFTESGISWRHIEIEAENGDIKTYTFEISKGETNNALLDNLEVIGHPLNEQFDPNVFIYTMTVPNSVKELDFYDFIVEASDPQATIVRASLFPLETDDKINVYEIQVRAVDGITVQTYRINIIREKSSDATIKSLETIEGKVLRTQNNVFEYDLFISTDYPRFNKDLISEIITTNDKAQVSYITTEDIVLSKTESQPFVISVRSEDHKVTQEYIFNVSHVQSSNNLLKSIVVEGGIFREPFNPNVFEYTVDIDEAISLVVINATPMHDRAKVLSVLGELEFTDYATRLEIKVAAENGDERSYFLNIERSLSRSFELENLELIDAGGASLSPEYDHFHTRYTATVKSDYDHVALRVSKTHPTQKVTLFDDNGDIVSLINIPLKAGNNVFELQIENPFGEIHKIEILIRREGNDENRLSQLDVIDPTIDIGFDRDVMEYEINIPNNYDQIKLDYTVIDPNSTVEVLGNQMLSDGNNDVIVRVKAENGDIRNYVIHVFKEPSDNNFLQGVSVSIDGNMEFDETTFFPIFKPGITSYTVSAPSSDIGKAASVQGAPFKKEVEVIGDSEELHEKITDGISLKQLKPGSNRTKLTTISPESGSVMIYMVNIAVDMNDDADLIGLEIFDDLTLIPFEKDGEKVVFDEKQSTYFANAGPLVKSIRVIATPKFDDSTVKIEGHENILNGDNIIRVTVTSSSRKKAKIYTIIVNKQESSDTSLMQLGIRHSDLPVHAFDLDQEPFEYTVPSTVDRVTVSAQSTDSLSKVMGIGTHSLAYGENIIVVTVEAPNGDRKEYPIMVYREYDNRLLSLTVNQGVLDPEFKDDKYEYTVFVDEHVERINVNAIARNAPIAVVSGNGWYELEKGVVKKIVISVESGDGVPKETVINVLRTASRNNRLTLLDIDEGMLSPTFDSDWYAYTTEIKDTHEEINLTVVPEDPNAYYEIISHPHATIDPTDNTQVKITGIVDEFTTVTIRVFAENGEYQDTTLRIQKQPEALFSNLLLMLEVSPITSMTPNIFDPARNNYTATVTEETNKITIKAVKQSPDAQIISGVGTFDVLAGINNYDIVVRSKDGIDNVYKVRIRQRPSKDATLSELAFNEGAITPVFSRNRMNYTLNVNSSVNALTQPHVVPYDIQTGWTISGDGYDNDLAMGENTVKIVTLAGDGVTSLTYTITVNRTDNSSIYLQSLESNIGDFHKPFEKHDEGPYRLEIPSNVNSIILSGIAEEPLSVSTITGLGLVDMTGVNDVRVPVVVTGNNGNTMTYFVDVVKAIDIDFSLSYLDVNPGSLHPVFDPLKTVYDVQLTHDQDRIEIMANTQHPGFIAGTGVFDVPTGTTTFYVTLTSDLGSVVTYTINVHRESISSAKITSLRFNEAVIDHPAFDKDDFEYDLTIPNEVDKLTINHIEFEDVSLTSNDYTMTYEDLMGVPINTLSVGMNVVKIKVTHPNPAVGTQTYTFNVTRQIAADNYLTSLDPSYGTLNPFFDRYLNNYDLEIPYDITEVSFTGNVSNTASAVTGLTTYSNLPVGVTEVAIVVTSPTNIPRTYIVRINRLQDDRNDLTDLQVIGGELTVPFQETALREYDVDVYENSTEVEFIGTIPPTATVVGLEVVQITEEITRHTISVRAQNGDVKHYRFTLTKKLSSDASVLNIIPSDGVLEPVFDPIIKDYNVVVDDTVTFLDFEVITSNSLAVVTGHENRQLAYGDNLFTIEIVSEDGTSTEEYNINVFRGRGIQTLEIDPDHLNLNLGETHQLGLIIGPVDATNTDVIWSSSNEDIVSIDPNTGEVTGHAIGSVTITVCSVQNPNICTTSVVEVLNLKLESEVLEIVRDGDANFELSPEYVIGAGLMETLNDFKDKFINENSTLKIYDELDNELTDISGFVGSGFSIKLVVNDTVYDELVIIVRGDSNGDGYVTGFDVGELKGYLSDPSSLSVIEKISLDVNNDGYITGADLGYLKDYLNQKLEDLNNLGG